MKESEILSTIEEKYKDIYIKVDSLPRPYRGKETTRAILLGTDPGNYSKGETKMLEYVFGLEDVKTPYFREINRNLEALNNLSIENLFIQNICKNYFNCDTLDNKHWKELANLWLPLLTEELDDQYSKDIPVLISAEIILEVILKNPADKKKAEHYYSNLSFVGSEENAFNRTVIPFYRHYKYNLSNWDSYREKVDNYFKTG
jgi:hypothetical protein